MEILLIIRFCCNCTYGGVVQGNPCLFFLELVGRKGYSLTSGVLLWVFRSLRAFLAGVVCKDF